MPLYFFNTLNGGRQCDADGTELRDDQAARKVAVQFAGSVLEHEPEILWMSPDFRVEVTNEAGRLLFTVVAHTVEAAAADEPRR